MALKTQYPGTCFTRPVMGSSGTVELAVRLETKLLPAPISNRHGKRYVAPDIERVARDVGEPGSDRCRIVFRAHHFAVQVGIAGTAVPNGCVRCPPRLDLHASHPLCSGQDVQQRIVGIGFAGVGLRRFEDRSPQRQPFRR